MRRRILITMPGIREHQMRYAEAINRLGLADHVDYCLQVGTTLKDLYPSDMSNMDDAAIKAYDDTKHRMNQQWAPKAFTHCFHDYEPDGWQSAKVRDGYDRNDQAFIAKTMRGLQMAAPDMLRSMYRIPISRRGIVTQGDIRNLHSIKDYLAHMQWVWQDCYPSGSKWINEDLSEDDIAKIKLRINSQYRLLEMLRKPIIPQMFLHYHMSVGRCEKYHEAVIDELKEHEGHIGIWTDLNVLVVNQIKRLQVITPLLKKWIGI